MTLNPLLHREVLAKPRRLSPESTWHQHTPFAMWLVAATHPSVFVELGTHHGDSYLAFCQGVRESGIDCKCYAIDTWEGDPHAGFYGAEVLDRLRQYHDRLYGDFSQLMQETFDSASAHFENEVVDLLHIDGYHTYEAVSHDFATWLPKLSERAIVLLHDTNTRDRDFGVWRFWDELRPKYRGFEFTHGHGLGVLAVGAHPPPEVEPLLEAGPAETTTLREFFFRLGEAAELATDVEALRREIESWKERVTDVEQSLRSESEAYERTLKAEREASHRRQTELRDELRRRESGTLAWERRHRELQERMTQVLESESWRLTAPLRAFGRLARRAARRAGGTDAHEAVGDAFARRRRLVYLGKRVVPKPIRRRLKERYPESVDALLHPSTPLVPSERRNAVLFVSGAPEVSKRYRCDHQAEQLELLGAAVDVATYGEVELAALAAGYGLFVLHRVPWDRDVELLLERVRELGGLTVFDTDDLVFDRDVMADVAALQDMSAEDVQLYEEGLHRYRRTMQSCDAVTVSTESLAELASEAHDRVLVTPNVVSVAMLESAASMRQVSAQAADVDGNVTVGYLSGTPTHRVDFLEAADGLLHVLETRPDVQFLVVGPMELDSRFDQYDGRIERLPLQPWSRLPEIQSRIDVNLAPLEARNPYTESKSCVKWLEAALVGRPTVASPRKDFARVVIDGENGLLAEDRDEWVRALETLVDDRARREAIGRRARDDVLSAHTTRARAFAYREALRTLVGEQPGTLTINWVLHAPIAANSGGYRNIFRIASELGSRGHVQRLCVDPVAHLEGFSDERITEFIDETFGIPANSEIVVGHSRLPTAEVSVATFWTTAPLVAEHERSLFRAYFIQDFEPEFYDAYDPLYDEALRTYDLPLRHICLGAHLGERIGGHTGMTPEVVDFALDPEFRLTTPLEERAEPVRVLFFARPSLRRRGYELGVEALRRVKDAHPEVEIAFFGTPEAELGPVPFDVHNLGVIDAAGVARAMNSSHVLLTFSLTNISNVPFEGMACGCAVVDLDLPNVTAMVHAGRTCLLAAPDAEAVAQAVVSLVADRDLRERLGRAGAAEATRRTWSHTADMFEQSLLRTRFVRVSVVA